MQACWEGMVAEVRCVDLCVLTKRLINEQLGFVIYTRGMHEGSGVGMQVFWEGMSAGSRCVNCLP